MLSWLAVVLAWAAQLIRHPGSVVFLLAVATAGVRVGRALLAGARSDAWRASRRAIVGVAVLAAVVAFDVGTLDVFNVVKLAVVVVAALLVLATWAAEWAWRGRMPLAALAPVRVRSSLLPPVLAVVVVTIVTTATSRNVRVSALGFHGSYDGLVLVVACAVLFVALAEAFDVGHVRACALALFGAGGGLVALYALFQTHDEVFDDASAWDWVTWGRSSFQRAEGAIWSTLGNPNHLAAFIVVLLPLGVVLALTARSRRERILVGMLEVVLLVELVQTTTRGAWIAALVSLPVLALLLSAEVLRHRRVALAVGGAFLAFVLASLAVVVSTPALNARYRALLEIGGRDSFTARIELSKSAVRIGQERPLVGSGPDMFRIAFQRHQTSRFVALFGPRRVANGAHNMFLNQFATQGVLGVAALAWLVAAVLWRGVSAVRHTEGERRLLAAGLLAAVVAFVVQAMFNVQQVALTVLLFALVALVELVARPGVEVAEPTVAEPPTAEPRPRPPLRLAAAAGIAVLCAAGATVAVRPYLADDSALRAARLAAEQRYVPAREHVRHASSVNPWEARYLAADAELSARAARRGPGNPEPRLREAVRTYRMLYALQPDDASYLHDYAEVLIALGRREAAAFVLARAVRLNPHDPLLKEKLETLA